MYYTNSIGLGLDLGHDFSYPYIFYTALLGSGGAREFYSKFGGRVYTWKRGRKGVLQQIWWTRICLEVGAQGSFAANLMDAHMPGSGGARVFCSNLSGRIYAWKWGRKGVLQQIWWPRICLEVGVQGSFAANLMDAHMPGSGGAREFCSKFGGHVYAWKCGCKGVLQQIWWMRICLEVGAQGSFAANLVAAYMPGSGGAREFCSKFDGCAYAWKWGRKGVLQQIWWPRICLEVGAQGSFAANLVDAYMPGSGGAREFCSKFGGRVYAWKWGRKGVLQQIWWPRICLEVGAQGSFAANLGPRIRLEVGMQGSFAANLVDSHMPGSWGAREFCSKFGAVHTPGSGGAREFCSKFGGRVYAWKWGRKGVLQQVWWTRICPEVGAQGSFAANLLDAYMPGSGGAREFCSKFSGRVYAWKWGRKGVLQQIWWTRICLKLLHSFRLDPYLCHVYSYIVITHTYSYILVYTPVYSYMIGHTRDSWVLSPVYLWTHIIYAQCSFNIVHCTHVYIPISSHLLLIWI